MARASPSGEREPPWQPTPSPLARIAEARSCDRRSSARPPKQHQPADRLIAASGVNQLRSISRDENGRPGHLSQICSAGATSISCVTPRHLSCGQAGRRRHAPCGQRCLCSYRGCPHWLARRHVWLQADLGEAVRAVDPLAGQRGNHPGADAMIANTGTARSLEVCPETT